VNGKGRERSQGNPTHVGQYPQFSASNSAPFCDLCVPCGQFSVFRQNISLTVPGHRYNKPPSHRHRPSKNRCTKSHWIALDRTQSHQSKGYPLNSPARRRAAKTARPVAPMFAHRNSLSFNRSCTRSHQISGGGSTRENGAHGSDAPYRRGFHQAFSASWRRGGENSVLSASRRQNKSNFRQDAESTLPARRGCSLLLARKFVR